MANLLGSPTRAKGSVIPVMLLLMYHKKPHTPRTYRLAETGKFFYFAVPHNLQKPECSLGCHNLNGQESPGAGMLPRTSN